MVDYIWLFDRDEKKEMGCSVLGSLIFHSLLLAALASTNFLYPLPGESDNVEILWYYPSLSPIHKATTTEKPVAAIAAVAERPSFQTRQAPAPTAGRASEIKATPPKTMGHEAAPSIPILHPPLPKVTAATEPASPPSTAPKEEPVPETEPEMVIPAAIAPRPEIKAAASSAEDPDSKKPADQEKIKERDSKAEPAAEEQKKPALAKIDEAPLKEVKPASPAPGSTVDEAARAHFSKVEATPVTEGNRDTAKYALPRTETITRTGEAQTVGAKISVPPSFPLATTAHGQSKGSERKETAVAPPKVPHPTETAREKKIPAADKEVKPVITEKNPTETKLSEQRRTDTTETKGIFFPPISGDLKLEISGKDLLSQQLKVAVLFREYPKTRRNIPMTRAEYKCARTLTPILMRSGESSRQAVIEVAGEGIYEFIVDTASEQPKTVTFTLKLYEKSSKARTRPLGSRQIAGNESIVKVLMPEGILWKDDDAFSGSFENSDSITKFNTDTGLLWREYK